MKFILRWRTLCLFVLMFLPALRGEIFGRDESALLNRAAALPVVVPNQPAVVGFESFGGKWTPLDDGTLAVDAGPGWRLVPAKDRFAPCASGEVQCELFVPDRAGGFSGINFKVSDNGVGPDHFNGYEIGFNPAANTVMIGAHRHNFTPLQTVPFAVPIGRWFEVSVTFDETSFSIFADGKPLFEFTEPAMNPNDALRFGTVALRSWQYPLSYRNFQARSFDTLGADATAEQKNAVPWTPLTFEKPAPVDTEIPETLALENIPPFLVLVREPLGRPYSVGNDLWQAQPTGPGCEIRLVNATNAETPVMVIFSDPDGSIYDMNLSYDAKTVFFSYHKFGEKFWNLWKINIDGTGLTQLTSGEFYDVSPCELPDGDLVFVSTRRFGHTVCQPGPSSNLFRMKWNDAGGDENSIRCVSMNTLSDFTPQMLPDGRVLFTRWEYIDRDLTYRQSLWTQNPDGSAYQLYFGNTIRDVGSFLQARPFPDGGSSRVLAAFTPHHGWPHGAIGAIDRSYGVEGEKGRGFVYWTREYPTIRDMSFEWGWRDPCPILDDAALCAFGDDLTTAVLPEDHPKERRFKIWLLDDSGRRRLIYEDAQKSCCYPIAVEERTPPAAMPDRLGGKKRAVLRPKLTAEQSFAEWVKSEPTFAKYRDWNIPELENPLEKSADAGEGDAVAEVVLVDVYNGIEPTIERGRVKKIRITEQIRKTEDLLHRAYDQSPVMSYGTYYAKRLWGEVTVEADGSAHFYVPALREVYFQAIDEDGKELQRMTSAVQFMPGEKISCMGCHEPRETVMTSSAAETRRPVAATRAADLPTIPNGLTKFSQTRPNRSLDEGVFDYVSAVQPVLDRYCVSCHAGQNPDGGCDLTGDATRFFSMSYDHLLGRSRSYRQFDMLTGTMSQQAAQKEKPLVQFFWLLWTPSGVNQPLESGTHASRLPDYFTPEHCGETIPDDDLRRVWFWIDANVPYYGTFANSRPATCGKRDLWAKPDAPDYAPWLAETIMPIYNERCKSCHEALDASDPSISPHQNASINWEGKFAWINLTTPENSPLLTAHLAKASGGRGLSTEKGSAAGEEKILFADTADTIYQKLLEAITVGKKEAEKQPRADQIGFAGMRPEP